MVGNRVILLRHADWKSATLATVKSPCQQKQNTAGESYRDDYIEFDDPQANRTNETHGEPDSRYRGTTVFEQFLRRVGATQPPPISHRSK
jgi:hypothetical protein